MGAEFWDAFGRARTVELAWDGGSCEGEGVGRRRGEGSGVGRVGAKEDGVGAVSTVSEVGRGVARTGSCTVSGWPAEVSIIVISTEKSEG